MLRRIVTAIALAAIAAGAACTPNGIGPSGGGATNLPQVHNIDVSITANLPVSTPYGMSGGFKPAVITIHVGDSVTFTNVDNPGIAHTATKVPPAAIPPSGDFPTMEPFGASAETQSGNTLSGGFSSGVLQPGETSQTIKADKPGTYLFGCFFHYPSPMRGAIVVTP